MGTRKIPISFSLIVPVYEEEDQSVEINIRGLLWNLDNLIKDKDYELLIICSQKRQRDLDAFPRPASEKIRFIDHEGNTELGYMFRRGVQLAAKEYVGLITPYNQVDLESFGPILKSLKNHHLVLAYIGNPYARPWHRILASAINTFLVNLSFGLKLKYYHLGFYRTALVKKVPFTTESHAAMVEAAVWLAKSGVSLGQVPFTMIRHSFKSKSRAFRIGNLFDVFRTYARLFWRIQVLKERLSLDH